MYWGFSPHKVGGGGGGGGGICPNTPCWICHYMGGHLFAKKFRFWWFYNSHYCSKINDAMKHLTISRHVSDRRSCWNWKTNLAAYSQESQAVRMPTDLQMWAHISKSCRLHCVYISSRAQTKSLCKSICSDSENVYTVYMVGKNKRQWLCTWLMY